MNRILAVTISVLLLFVTSYAPAYGVSVKMTDSFAAQSASSDRIINHSSFVQIPKQAFNMCVKVSEAFQKGILLSSSGGETAIKAFYKIMSINIFFDMVNISKPKQLSVSYADAYIFKYADNSDKGVNGLLIFMTIFGFLQVLLCLLAVKKANLPYSIILKNKKTRYQLL
ncbi:MAG: hypothetical protein FWG57_00740 [Endomicrobia bacterium]|nr:hypothetical protein [Endomicrobiia bacterium]